MKQTTNPTLNNQTQQDVNLTNEETASIYICKTPAGEHVLYVNVNGINLLRLYSGTPIIIDRVSEATNTPLDRTKPARLK